MIEVIAYITALSICFLIGWLCRINCRYPEHKESAYKKEQGIDNAEK